MLLQNIYEDFLNNTSLKDGVFKTSFVEISEILSKLNDVKWVSVKYKLGNHLYDTNFDEYNQLPSFLVEIVQNIFRQMCLFPEESTTELKLIYKDKDYIITTTGNDIEIPEDIRFLKDYNLFDFYYLSKGVVDIGQEFDKLFDFINLFKINPEDVFHSLNKKWAKQGINNKIKSGELDENSLLSQEILVQNLETRKQELIALSNQINKEREELESFKSELSDDVDSRESLLKEKTSLTNEYDVLKTNYKTSQDRLDQLNETLIEIDKELTGINFSIENTIDISEKKEALNSLKSDRGYLQNKKTIFGKELEGKIKELGDLIAMLDELTHKLAPIDRKLNHINDITSGTLDDFDTKFKELSDKYEAAYTELLKVENNLKIEKEKSINNSLEYEKSKSLIDIDISDIENTSIATLICRSLQPTPITAACNYLKTYFIFLVRKELDEYVETNEVGTQWATAMVTRMVLTKYFGLKLHNMFSMVSYQDPNISKIITVQRG